MEEKKGLGSVQKLADEQSEKVTGGVGVDILTGYDVICRNCGHRWQSPEKPEQCPNCKKTDLDVLSFYD
ncbi:MAG: hypothetical protein IJQ62_02900 [Clostridia bacterium]|nr:hypothetical protein [Clostridia bacterium]